MEELPHQNIVDPESVTDMEVLHNAIATHVAGSELRRNVLTAIMEDTNAANKLASLQHLASAWGVRILAASQLTQ